ncbi:hypothetical protein IWX49DRAFT_10986 [Phyllosticta citricarpa]|uniref:Secreted protein n=1 Tax=Phyllosticta citricarpa TaxID=55181 RepID=A0ABR1MS59_9PEZI
MLGFIADRANAPMLFSLFLLSTAQSVLDCKERKRVCPHAPALPNHLPYLPLPASQLRMHWLRGHLCTHSLHVLGAASHLNYSDQQE